MAKGDHSETFSRRQFLAMAAGALGVSGFAVAAGCMGTGAPSSSSTSAPSEDPLPTDVSSPAFTVAHQAAVQDDEGNVYFVDFSAGSLYRRPAGATDASADTLLYTNGQVNHLGIRYLACVSGEVFFCDAPSASVLAVPCEGGDPRTVWTSGDPNVLPLILGVESDRLYLSLLDGTSMSSTLFSVGPDGSEPKSHRGLPSGFYAQLVDAAADTVYYSGVDPETDVRQVRRSSLSGSGEKVLFSLDGVASASSSISWQLTGGRLLVEVQDDVAATNHLLSYSLEGTDEQLVYDFSSQKMLFDLFGSSLFFINRETFSVMARRSEGGPLVQEVAVVPHRSPATTVSFLEAGADACWVTTVTPGTDNANEYVTYMVARETGEVTEL